MADVKTCRQCGEIKPIAQFRKYYGGRTGSYTTCMQCEQINSRYKYLRSKVSLTDAEQQEVERIGQLYMTQQLMGLRPPRVKAGATGTTGGTAEVVDQMLKRYQRTAAGQVCDNAPPQLTNWLTCELTEEPEQYIDDVYEKLMETYRPVKYIDKETMIPVRDDTYTETLKAILDRFYAYEDTYYSAKEKED